MDVVAAMKVDEFNAMCACTVIGFFFALGLMFLFTEFVRVAYLPQEQPVSTVTSVQN